MQISVLHNALGEISENYSSEGSGKLYPDQFSKREIAEFFFTIRFFRDAEDNLIRQLQLLKLECQELGGHVNDWIYSYEKGYRVYGYLREIRKASNSSFVFYIKEFDPFDPIPKPFHAEIICNSYRHFEVQWLSEVLLIKLIKFKKYCKRSGIRTIEMASPFFASNQQAEYLFSHGITKTDHITEYENKGDPTTINGGKSLGYLGIYWDIKKACIKIFQYMLFKNSFL